MATLNSPIELPTARHSFVEFPMTANIQDPSSWNNLQNEGNGTKGSSKGVVVSELAGRSFPKPPSRPASRGQNSLRAKDSPAMEFPPQELEAPLSYFPPRQSSAQGSWSHQSVKQNTQDASSDAGHTTQISDDYTGSTRSTSTTGTNSLPDAQVYSLPTSAVTKEETAESPVLPSSRSAHNSVKKSVVPTSKYKKKPPASLRSTSRRKSEVDSPLDSPMSSYTQVLQSPTSIDMQMPMPSELPAAITSTSSPTPPPESQSRSGQAPLQHAKSTASVRKARALHSHPSMPSIRPDELAISPQILQPSPNSATPSPNVLTQSPNLSGLRIRKSVDTTRNRPSLYDLSEPTPAPNTPLPDLPAGVPPLSRSASRNIVSQPTPPPDVHVRPGTSSSTIAPILRRQDTSPQIHAEMANFMTSNSKIIFRRFHDVHIRLLLTLQDEIAALERELAEIESVENPIDVDREARRVRVLSELRKLLAEYDHLYTNWNLMQGSKADAKTREELEQWLKRPNEVSPSSTISTTAIDDLVWLQNHGNDLSCVDLNAKKEKAAPTPREVSPEKKKENVKAFVENTTARSMGVGGLAGLGLGGGGGGGGNGVGGGFASLFTSCVGKRK